MRDALPDAVTVRGEERAADVLRVAVRRPVIARAVTRWWDETGNRAAEALQDPARRGAWLADLSGAIADALETTPDADLLADALADLNAAVEAYAILHTTGTGEFEEPAAAQRWKRLRGLVLVALIGHEPPRALP